MIRKSIKFLDDNSEEKNNVMTESQVPEKNSTLLSLNQIIDYL